LLRNVGSKGEARNALARAVFLNRLAKCATAVSKRVSPVAWLHIHFLEHYAFRDKQHPIDLEAILASVNLQ
jgi:hypothetical protein